MATWITSPFESASSGNLVMGTVRKDVQKFIDNPRFKFRVEVTWTYTPAAAGMPDEATSKLMESAAENLNKSFSKDPVALLTGIYTGEGARTWVFYTLSLHIFQRKFNEALAEFPPFPLTFEAEEDPSWEEYREMLALASKADDDHADDSDLADDLEEEEE